MSHSKSPLTVGAWAAGAGAGAGRGSSGAAGCGWRAAAAGFAQRGGRCALDRRQQRALAHLVADLDLDLADHAGFRRGHVERRLVAFERENHIFLGDGLAGLDVNLDDRHVLEVADIGKLDVTRHALTVSIPSGRFALKAARGACPR